MAKRISGDRSSIGGYHAIPWSGRKLPDGFDHNARDSQETLTHDICVRTKHTLMGLTCSVPATGWKLSWLGSRSPSVSFVAAPAAASWPPFSVAWSRWAVPTGTHRVLPGISLLDLTETDYEDEPGNNKTCSRINEWKDPTAGAAFRRIYGPRCVSIRLQISPFMRAIPAEDLGPARRFVR